MCTIYSKPTNESLNICIIIYLMSIFYDSSPGTLLKYVCIYWGISAVKIIRIIYNQMGNH